MKTQLNPRLCIRSSDRLVFSNHQNLYQVDPYAVKFDSCSENIIYDYTRAIAEENVIMIANSFTKFYLVHHDMKITEFDLPSRSIREIDDIKQLGLTIKFMDCGENTVWVVTDCNRLFNFGEDIFSQLGKSKAKHKIFQEVDNAFIPEHGIITHFSCGRYHTCLAINEKQVFGIGYSSFYQTGLRATRDASNFEKSYFLINDQHGVKQHVQEFPHKIKKLTCSRYFTAFVSNTNEFWVTGSAENNQTFTNKTCECFTKILFDNIIDAFPAKNGYHTHVITSAQQIQAPGPFAVVSSGWNDNNQCGVKYKDSSSYGFMDLPILEQHDPRVANIQLFPVFTRSYLRYENLLFGTCKAESAKTFYSVELPFHLSPTDRLVVSGGNNFTLFFATASTTRTLEYFLNNLKNVKSAFADVTFYLNGRSMF
ncbi:hypothetical protein C9374_010762 [Naegleria lovaniensis]|uniref:Uncharacterized protein n=1 Tax=Naegleria lovaniensis TaxID=51637 RepID=A0AA88KDW0_NAELO|nr:uncharacterized protein C9374_010762 [Naegleria lovaniensis]KAG2374478.1 hypothetical protein C9374_010762 [Naegleria lovaniensis]